METNYETFIEEEITPLVAADLDVCRDKIVEEVTNNLFIQKIKPRLLSFRNHGGKIVDLKKEIASDASAYQPELTQRIDDIYTTNITRLYQTALEKTRYWLLREGLKLSDAESISRKEEPTIDGKPVDPEIAESITATIGLVVGAIGTMIIAAICGGSGMALIASGPIGLLIGAIIGVAVMFVAIAGAEEKAKEIVENTDIHRFVLYPILTDAKIEDCRQKMQIDLRGSLNDKSQTITEEIRYNLENVIQLEIEKLSELNIAH